MFKSLNNCLVARETTELLRLIVKHLLHILFQASIATEADMFYSIIGQNMVLKFNDYSPVCLYMAKLIRC